MSGARAVSSFDMVEHHSHRVRRPRSHSRYVPSRAIDDLRFIRETMERSSSFTAVPGWGQVAMGATALLAALLASRPTWSRHWLSIWLVDAVVAASIALWASRRKAQRAGLALTSGPGRKFAFSFLPPLAAGAVLTIALFRLGMVRALPGAWLLLYGTGIITGGAFSVAVVPVMGICLALTGVVALFLPAWGNLFMAVGFGGLHILFGIFIARRHGG